jgi:hypothetical protein
LLKKVAHRITTEATTAVRMAMKMRARTTYSLSTMIASEVSPAGQTHARQSPAYTGE